MPFFSPQNLHHNSYSFSKKERIDPFLSQRNGSWGSLLTHTIEASSWDPKAQRFPVGVGYRLRLKCAEISIRNPITVQVVVQGWNHQLDYLHMFLYIPGG